MPSTTSWIEFCEREGYPVGSKQISKRVHDVRSGTISCVATLFSRNYELSDRWLHFLSREFIDFPVSQKCCNELKKRLSHKTGLDPILGTGIQESSMRTSAWEKSGCNNYSLGNKRDVSHPTSLWTDTDVEQYVNDEQVELSEIYTQYQQKRTGCVNCPYGAHCSDDSRFDLLKRIEPTRYDYFMSTKLRRVFALSDVDILSDLEYMLYKDLIQEGVKHWHKEAEGIDRYLAWKVRYTLSVYTAVESLGGVKHIEMYPLKYPIEKISDEIEKERERQPRK